MKTVRNSLSIFLCLIIILSLSVPAFAGNGSTIVCRTKSGAKYHNYGCRYLKSCIEVTLEDAVKVYRLEPCSVCRPPVLDNSSPSLPGSSNSNNSSKTNGSTSSLKTSSSSAASTTKPKNGDVLYRKYEAKPSKLDFVNDSGYNCFVSLIDENGKTVLDFYSTANKTATVDVPVGTYTIEIAYGKTWRDTKRLFGSDTAYAQSNGDLVIAWGDYWEFSFS